MTKKNDCIVEEMLLVDEKVFHDNEEHEYEMRCYDGYAEGELMDDEDENAPKKVKMTYPKLADILADEDKAYEILEYRGLYDLTPSDLHYGDVCMVYGTIC